MKAIISILCLILISSSVCWWNEGHMIVAEIAKLELSVKNPEVINFFEDLTKILEPMRHGKVNSFSESATWPDIMKSYGAHYLDNWHFDDIKVNFTDPSTPDVKEHVEDNALFFLVRFFYLSLKHIKL